LTADGRHLLAHNGLTAVEKDYRGNQTIIDFSNVAPQVTKLTVMSRPGGKERREYHASRSIAVIDGDYFYQYYPERKLVVKRKLPGGYDTLRKENLRQTLVSYELKNAPSEPIAGRRAQLYEFHPRQAGSRPVRKVWVDVETGLVLRMEIYSPDNRLFWLSVFEDIDYKSHVSPASFSLKIPAGVKVVESKEGRCLSREEAEETAGLPLGLPRYLPGGFVEKCVRVRRAEGHGEIQVLYSDGLSLLSLFESSRYRPLKSAGPGRSVEIEVGGAPGVWRQLGLVSALHWQSPQAYLTLLGEISRDELLKVAESIYSLRELSRP
jgi:outer membrane lipoprotein-sorting protein